MNLKFKYIKLLLVIAISFLGIGDAYPMLFSYYMDGYWSNWESNPSYHGQGGIKNMVLYNGDEHPSVFLLRVQTDNYTTPSKKEIKEHIKNKTWFEYTGTVEYWVSEEYPTIKDALKRPGHFLVTHPDSRIGNFKNSGSKVKRTAKAIIKCQLYENGVPKVINLWFDHIGYGIHIQQSDY